MYQLQQDISQTFNIKDAGLESEPCYIPNPKLLDFDKIVEEFLDSYKTETEKPENDPANRDFSKPAPFQNSTASGLFGLYVKFCCLEVVFKSMFLFSNFGPKGVFESQFMIDYIVNYVTNDITNKISSTNFREKVMKVVKEVTKIDNEDAALKTLILRNINTSSIEEFVTKLFDSKYTSFDERIRNEIVENAKEVPDVENYPKLILRDSEGSIGGAESLEQQRIYENINYYLELEKTRSVIQFPEMGDSARAQRIQELRREADAIEGNNSQGAADLRRVADQLENPDELQLTPEERLNLFIRDQREAADIANNLIGYKQVPVSAKIPNLYDRFAFKGYSEELVQKKINSGHFWMEKFYRIKNFPEFFRLYNELFVSVNSDPLFQNLQHIGTSPETSLYS
jgi:hypothetical protein